MSLSLTVIESLEGVSLKENTKVFGEQGGTIGRGSENSWVLPDPERFLSTCHSKITCEAGCYFLTDTSTNGTFINGSVEPMGNGNRVQLKDGDQFELGDYKFRVSLWTADHAAGSTPFESSSASPFGDVPVAPVMDDPFSTPFGQIAPDLSDPFASPVATPQAPSLNPSPLETDPLAALDKANQPSQSATFGSNPLPTDSYSDRAGAMNQSVAWPEASPEVGAIPENWDDDFGMDSPPPPEPQRQSAPILEPKMPRSRPRRPKAASPAAPSSEQGSESDARKRALERANQKIQAELEGLKRQISAKQNAPSTGVDMSMISAMGFAEHNLSDEQATEINEIVGELVREIVSGMMQVLSSRSSIKNEFRMNMTTIQPVENNPLKFSANVDDALENMFLKKGNSYKKPIESVREGFEGIVDHQVAILAGVRSAFKCVIKRFDPEVLGKRFEKQNKGGLIPGSVKAKNWDAYNDYYANLVDDMDNSFQYLFGDEFVQAYEDQLIKLAMARKKTRE